MASEKIDLTGDSDDEDLEAAIRASLFGFSSGGGGSSACSSSPSSGNTPIENSNSTAGKSKRRLMHPSSSSPSSQGGETGRSHVNKRPRSEPDRAASESSIPPPLFRLLSTSPNDGASTGSVSIGDLLSGDFQEALLCNYMVDMGLLATAQPRLQCVPVVVVHGDKENS